MLDVRPAPATPDVALDITRDGEDQRRPCLVRRALGLLRPFPALLLVGALAQGWANPPPEALEPKSALVEALARDFALSASPSDVHFVDAGGTGWRPTPRRAWLLAQRPNLPNDVFLVHAEQTPEGRLLGVRRVFNISETSAADEASLRAAASWAAWKTGDRERTYLVHTADLTRSPDTSAFTRSEQWRWRLHWLQRYGQLGGLAQRSFKLDPAPQRLRLELTPELLKLTSDGSAIEVPRNAPATRGSSLLLEQPHAVPAPGNWITWAVDRVRATSWFGDERMQWLKAVVYRAKDQLEVELGLEGNETANEFDTRVAPVTSDAQVPAHQQTSAPSGASEWPPKNLSPELDPPWDAEGVWQSLQGDPFTRTSPEPRSNFLTTFIRTDPERKFSRVLIVLWDPSRIELHMMSGTEEPKSATGATGAGQIPRRPELLRRLVGAFNGGFQGTHGDFGMMVDGTEYVPAKPYGATVARMVNGEVGFGTWPAEAAVPPDMVAFRQNLTPLVAQGQLNPYERLWWGGVPQGWQDDTQTVRSGLCRTREGFVAYFYGTKTDAQHLGRAMLSASCVYGMHLDMNQGHTGMEFYVADEAALLPPLGLPLQSMWQAEGPLPDAPGFAFRGRRLFRGMQLMNFPRYIGREARDFFYLTRRPTVGQAPLAAPSPDALRDGVWTTSELPQFGGTPAQARTSVRPNPAQPSDKVHLLQLDPYHFEPVAIARGDLLASWTMQGHPTELTVWWDEGRAVLAERAPRPGAVALFRGSAQVDEAPLAAAGVDSNGFVIYGEIATIARPGDTRANAALLQNALRLAGASRLVYLGSAAGVVAGGRDLSLHPQQVPSVDAVHLVRVARSGFQDVFKDTPVVKREIWRALQK